jgi:glycosyltransferase involved in cell wall biosynthesis
MLSIIIPTKDRAAILNKTIDSVIKATQGMNAEILIINDSQSDISFPLHATISVHNSRRSSAAISRNLGAKNAKGDLLLFLDDDILIDSACLKELYEKTISGNNVIYLPNWEYPKDMSEKLLKTNFGRFVIRSNYSNLKGYLGDAITWSDTKRMKYVHVASYCLMLKRELFEKINGYSENFSFAGFEDHDLSIKIVAQKTEIFIEPKLLVLHNEEDKLQLNSWLSRMEKGAITRKQAVNMGYSDLKLHYNFFEATALSAVYALKRFLVFLTSIIPNLKFFDPLYSLIFKTLISSYIYKGYSSKK